MIQDLNSLVNNRFCIDVFNEAKKLSKNGHITVGDFKRAVQQIAIDRVKECRRSQRLGGEVKVTMATAEKIIEKVSAFLKSENSFERTVDVLFSEDVEKLAGVEKLLANLEKGTKEIETRKKEKRKGALPARAKGADTRAEGPVEGSLKIGDLLHHVNWLNPTYSAKKVSGDLELQHLQQISKVLRSAPPLRSDESSRIAHAIKDWSHFAELPFQIRAAVRYSLQGDNETDSYKKMAAKEFFVSLKRAFSLQSASGKTVRRGLQEAVGESLRALGGERMWEAFSEVARERASDYTTTMKEADRLAQIGDRRDGWGALLSAPEKEKLASFRERIMKRKRASLVEQETKILHDERIKALRSILSEEEATTAAAATRKFLEEKAGEIVSKKEKDPQSDFYKECQQGAEELLADEALLELWDLQTRLFEDQALFANLVIEKCAKEKGMSVDDIQKGIEADPSLFPSAAAKLQESLLLINDKMREEISGKEPSGTRTIPPLSLGERKILRGVATEEANEQERADRQKKRAIATARAVGVSAAILLLGPPAAALFIAAAIITLPFWSNV